MESQRPTTVTVRLSGLEDMLGELVAHYREQDRELPGPPPTASSVMRFALVKLYERDLGSAAGRSDS